ncbi:MAG: tetratricopeptide repeat protein [Alphaproteobacteria bacterium]|nr:tetratricopeptide repeat protein [Alphaproteobacteria bacterium]
MSRLLKIVPMAFVLCALAGAPITAVDAASSSKKPEATAPDDPYKMGQDLVKEGKFKEAEEAFMAAVQKTPTDADALNMLAYSQRRQGELDEAFENYGKALALDPNHKGAHEYIGEAYLMVGNLPKAEEHLAALLKLCNGCEESRDLAKAIQRYKEKNKQSSLDQFVL